MDLADCLCVVHDCPGMATKRGRCNKHLSAYYERSAKRTPTSIDRARPEQRRRRANAVRQWRNQHGDWCPGYKVPAHPAAVLTAEHITLDNSTDELTVLCSSCNSRHGAETKARLNKPV